ncbi:hypothetical protein BVY04_03575 [bacterium M21]|nr:hypothetical protein BVY04_03575 [bacterium M21]
MLKLPLGLISFLLLTHTWAQSQPNIIVFMADDLGYHDVGFQGSTHIKTPHLDKLATAGMRFTDGHVTACVCSPSRAGFITGRYQQRFGHEGNCPRGTDGMDVNEVTIGQALQKLGYKTCIIGKWHLGATEAQYPTNRGFDEFWGLREGSRTFWHDPKKTDKPGNPRAIEHNGKQVPFEGHLTDSKGDKAVEYIEANKDTPFFMFLSFTAPHGPLQSKKEDMEALNLNDNYAGLVYGMDRNIGKVMNALDKHELTDNTMIWFLSDNGGTVRQASNHPLGGRKGSEFEGGTRVPFILNWKGHVPSGTYDPMVSALDIFPTCVVAAGGTTKFERPLDGVDLVPYLNGQKKHSPHPQLYFRKLECAAIRDGRWKMIRAGRAGYALYNLNEDLAERENLASQMPEKLEELKKKLKAWERDKMDPLWGEGSRWEKYRYFKHKGKFETGKYPADTPKRKKGEK